MNKFLSILKVVGIGAAAAAMHYNGMGLPPEYKWLVPAITTAGAYVLQSPIVSKETKQ